MAGSEPTIPKRVLRASGGSPMRFMEETVAWDSEVGNGAPVRFRAPFVMPSWDGVESGEIDYIVSDAWMRLDILADKFYSNVELWWVIAARNDIDLPDVSLYPGRLLKIPKREWVERVLMPQGY